MIIAQLSVVPIGEGTSVSKYVQIAVRTLRDSGVRFEVGAMSTALQVDNIDTLFDVVKRVHESIIRAGAKRVVLDLKVDDRRDKDATIESKIDAATSIYHRVKQKEKSPTYITQE
ncbi:MAG: MTH1187 family thiamine-binding protein [Thermoplasmata archaeon]